MHFTQKSLRGLAMKNREFYHEIAREFINPFLDAGSKLKVTDRDDTSIHVEGSKRFETIEADLVFLGQFPWLARLRTRRGRQELEDIATFLSSPRFGDLDAVARSIIGHLKARLSDPRGVVDGRLRQELEEVTGEGGTYVDKTASAVLPELLGAPTARGTRLTLLHGHAGSGKTWMLMNAALRQAQAYLSREQYMLFLYIDAQGLNLRSLEQQISYQLDLYNGVLRVAEVRPLLRLGVLSLIVDGFDELIMPSGYNDTLNALASYVESLAGGGSVLASARSAFFHSYDLDSAGVSLSVPVEQHVLEVLPWESEERKQYCTLYNQRGLIEDLENAIQSSRTSRDLLSRPFVVSRMLELLSAGRRLDDTELMVEIEQSFLERERVEKLLDEEGAPLLTPAQFQKLLTEIALEMWHLGQTSLEVETLRTLVELYLEGEGFRLELRRIVAHRIDVTPILQLLESRAGKPAIQFPHEILFARFLARGILDLLGSAASTVRSVLREAPLGESTVEQISLLSQQGGSVAFGSQDYSMSRSLMALTRLGQRISSIADEDRNIRLNVGSISTALLQGERGFAGSRIRNAQFYRTEFKGANLDDVIFSGCYFEEIDARGGDWTGARFEDCLPVNKLVATEGQEFPESLPPVLWLLMETAEGTTEEFFGEAPSRAALFPRRRAPASSVQELSPNAAALATLTQRVAKRALRVFWMTTDEEDADDRGMRRLKQDALWAEVIHRLDHHGLLRRELRSRQGVNAEMFHIENARELLRGAGGDLSGLPKPVRAYWRELRSPVGS